MHSLGSLTDSQLAQLARRGDSPAFSELVARYRGVIHNTIRRRGSAGLSYDDQYQEAAIGLFDACRHDDPGRDLDSRFPGLAALCIRQRVWAARKRARGIKQCPLNEALSLDAPIGEDRHPLIDDLRAGDGADPAVVVELREELARLAVEGERRPEQRRWKQSRPRRFYTPSDISTALELVAGGKSVRQAAAAVGATHPTVLRWLRDAA